MPINSQPLFDCAVIGLAVMGQNLARNIASRGYRVAVYNRTAARAQEFAAAHPNPNIAVAPDLPSLAAMLQRPRRVILMVQAGAAVDAVLSDLKNFLEPGDIIIDGGNSYFADTERRSAELARDGLLYLGVGISGGEEGALHGPSIMPGGPREAYDAVAPILTAIAARASDGEPMVAYLGPNPVGHYVKMVHNGIEYAFMETIAEVYDVLLRGLAMDTAELADVFTTWSATEVRSFLVEISGPILRQRAPDSRLPLIDLILDAAEQKGTGMWTSQQALTLGVPTPTITAAVEVRQMSAFKEQRVVASRVMYGPLALYDGDADALLGMARNALYLSVVVAFAQGMVLLKTASDAHGWNLDLAAVASIWRAGCIIRAAVLDDIVATFRARPDLDNLLLGDAFLDAFRHRDAAWRGFLRAAIDLGVPTPAVSASLAYYDAYRSSRLPANLIQAQRDYFGAHTYQRIDRPGVFHTLWDG
ncbi:MAG: NADP-dependent phosphogluconate dehydrogenase [Anaerolineae bacterium]